MYKDIITELKIPGIFILLSGKNQFLYDYIFSSIINIVTNNRKFDLNILLILSDSEKALVNSIKKTSLIVFEFHAIFTINKI